MMRTEIPAGSVKEYPFLSDIPVAQIHSSAAPSAKGRESCFGTAVYSGSVMCASECAGQRTLMKLNELGLRHQYFLP